MSMEMTGTHGLPHYLANQSSYAFGFGNLNHVDKSSFCQILDMCGKWHIIQMMKLYRLDSYS